MVNNEIFEVENEEEIEVLGKCPICGKVCTKENDNEFTHVYFSETEEYEYVCEDCKKIVGFVIFVQSAIHVSDLLMGLLACGYQKMKLYGFAKTLLIRLMNSVVSVVGIVMKVYFQKMAYALTVNTTGLKKKEFDRK